MPHFVKNNARQNFVKPEPMEDEDLDNVKWNPTPETFEHFLKRDLELATGNVRSVMNARNYPMSFREMKDSLLHSQDVIERVLTAGMASGSIVENNGKYSIVRASR